MTLIEIIVVIAIIAIVMSLLAPTTALVRGKARQIVSLGRMRSLTQVLGTYAVDYRGGYPYLTDPQATWTVLRSMSTGLVRQIPYFGVYDAWHIGLLDGYLGGQPQSEVLQQPYVPRTGPGLLYKTSYIFPCTFIAHSDFWNESRRLSPALSQFRPTTQDDVVWPSAKTLLVGLYSAKGESISGIRELSFVDAHAETVNAESMSRSYLHSEGLDSPYSDHTRAIMPPGMHTIDGVRGRDK